MRWAVAAAAVTVLVAGCPAEESPGDGADLAKLDVGDFATAVRQVDNKPTPQEATLLEGIRMPDAVADSSQFDSPLLYGWRADPIPDTASLAPLFGEAGKAVLDQNGWLAGYRVGFADQPQPADGTTRAVYVGLSITLLRFPDDAAAHSAAAALEITNWKDLAKTVAVPPPRHPEVLALHPRKRCGARRHRDRAVRRVSDGRRPARRTGNPRG